MPAQTRCRLWADLRYPSISQRSQLHKRHTLHFAGLKHLACSSLCSTPGRLCLLPYRCSLNSSTSTSNILQPQPYVLASQLVPGSGQRLLCNLSQKKSIMTHCLYALCTLRPCLHISHLSQPSQLPMCADQLICSQVMGGYGESMAGAGAPTGWRLSPSPAHKLAAPPNPEPKSSLSRCR